MWSYKFFFSFLKSCLRLDRPRQLVLLSLLLLSFLYPGHNFFQKLVVHPGIVKSFSIDSKPVIPYPMADGAPAPYLSARAVVIQDIASKTIIYSKNPDTAILPASTTKIMTALVALDYWQDLNTAITVKNEDRAIGQTIELQRGESLTVGSILSGLLIHSGNDAALALADNYPGGYSAFVAAMNQKAKSLHLDHTTYKNPSGIEQYGHVTTARDLAILSGVAISNPVLAEIVATKYKLITDVTGNIKHPLSTTNELLGVIPGIKGLKTGWTENAGECLISVVERGGHTVVSVVMGSSDRFGETAKLIDWTFAHHDWVIPSI